MRKIRVTNFFLLFVVLCLNTAVFGQLKEAKEQNDLGVKMLEQKKPEEARIHFQKALKYDELYVDPYFNLGLTYKMLGDKEQEIKYYYQARDKSPSDNKIKNAIYNFHFERAQELVTNGEEEEGMKVLESLLPESRSPSAIYELLMNTSYRKGKLDLLKDYTKKFLAIRREGKVGDDPEVVLAHFYYAFICQKAGNEYEAFSQYLNHGVMLLDKYGDKLKDYKWKKQIDKLKAEIESSNSIVKSYSEAVRNFDNKNYPAAKNTFSGLVAKYPKVSKFEEYLSKTETKIKMLNTISEVTKGLMNANNMSENTKDQRDSKRKQLLGVKQKLAEAISLGASGPEVENMETTIKQMIDKCENPEIKLNLSKEQFEKNMKAFSRLIGSDGEEQFELHKLYLKAQKFYDDKDYHNAQLGFQELMGMVNDVKLGTCPSCGKPNVTNADECKSCNASLVREGGYLDAKGKAEECALILKKDETMKNGWIIGGVLGGLGVIILFFYLKRELPIRRKNKALDTAQSLFEAKKYKKAITYFKKVQEYPVSPRETVKIYLGLCQCYFKLEQYDDAIKHANQVLRHEERNEQARVVIAKSYLGKKYVSDTALYEYKFLINLEPNNKELLELLCNYYMKKEIVNKDAVDVYKKMHKLEPQDKKVMDVLGLAYMEEGRTDSEAQIMYEEILKFSPEKIEFRKMLIEIYNEKGLHNDVIKECKNIFKVDVDDKRIHTLFYDAFSSCKKITEAILYYEQLTQTYPNKKNIKMILDKLKEKRHMNPELDENSSNISEHEREKIKQAKSSGQTISICPSCAKLNPLGATSCTECGASLIIE